MSNATHDDLMDLEVQLIRWAQGYEYYADAYCGAANGPPPWFPDEAPDQLTAIAALQEGARLIAKYFNLSIKLQQNIVHIPAAAPDAGPGGAG